MADQQVSFEQLEADLKDVNWAEYEQGGTRSFTAADVAAAPANVLQKVCDVYRRIRPILAAVASFPLLPPFIKNGVKAFMSVMDNICP